MPLRVMTFNIHEGGGPRLALIERVLRSVEPDVVALQEASDLGVVEALAARLNMQFVYGEGNCPAAVAWLSRLPILHAENHRLPALAKTLLEVEVSWDDRSVRLFATHLADRRQDASAYPRLGEVRAILGVLRGDLHVLVGDLNAIAPGDSVGTPPGHEPLTGDASPGAPREVIGSLLRAGYADCFRAVHPRATGFTYDVSRKLFLRLDYVFASAGLAPLLQACTVVGGAGASDHLPLLAAFSVRSGHGHRRDPRA